MIGITFAEGHFSGDQNVLILNNKQEFRYQAGALNITYV